MMELKIAVVLAALVWPAAAIGQEPIPGAKELFYDPVSASATRVSPGSTEKPPATKPPAKSTQPVRSRETRRSPNLPPTPETRASQKVLGLSYWVELQGASGAADTQVTGQRVFHSGERIRLHFLSNADGNIALIQLGSSGTSQVLFPDPGRGLTDSRLVAGEDKVLPDDASWFRFDQKPGTERLIVLFARGREDLDRFPLRPSLDSKQTEDLIQNTRHVQGSKDLFVETETKKAGEVGTYGVNVSGQPVVLEIVLEHR